MDEQAAGTVRHQSRLRVRYAETDQMGVVYYANYFVWMEIGRVELVRSLGMNYKELEQTEGLFLSVIEADCRYMFPARYDQEIVIDTKMTSSNDRIVEFGYEIGTPEHGRMLAKGFTKHMWLNRDFRPTRLPEHVLSRLRLS